MLYINVLIHTFLWLFHLSLSFSSSVSFNSTIIATFTYKNVWTCQNWFLDQLWYVNQKFIALSKPFTLPKVAVLQVLYRTLNCTGAVVFHTALLWFLGLSRVLCYHPLYNVFIKILLCNCVNLTWIVSATCHMNSVFSNCLPMTCCYYGPLKVCLIYALLFPLLQISSSIHRSPTAQL